MKLRQLRSIEGKFPRGLVARENVSFENVSRGFVSFVRSCAPKPKRQRANSAVATRTRRDFEVIAIRNPFNCYFFSHELQSGVDFPGTLGS